MHGNTLSRIWTALKFQRIFFRNLALHRHVAAACFEQLTFSEQFAST